VLLSPVRQDRRALQRCGAFSFLGPRRLSFGAVGLVAKLGRSVLGQEQVPVGACLAQNERHCPRRQGHKLHATPSLTPAADALSSVAAHPKTDRRLNSARRRGRHQSATALQARSKSPRFRARLRCWRRHRLTARSLSTLPPAPLTPARPVPRSLRPTRLPAPQATPPTPLSGTGALS
jgi:hypothetical protein